MNYFQNLDLLFIGLVLAANGILGFTIFLNNKNNATNRAFFVFVISTIPWGIFNYFIFQSVPRDAAIWILRGHVFFAVWYCFFLFRLFFIFPNEKISFPKIYYIFILPVVIFTSLITLTPLVFERVTKFSTNGGIESVSNGLGIIIFGITVVSLIIYSIYLLWRKLIKANDGAKSQLKLLLLGVTITFFLHIVFNFILPVLFNNPDFAPFGSAFIFPFIVFASYAIIRHKLFNLKVAGTTVLVFALSIVSFVEVTQTRDIFTIIYRSLVLVLVLVFGILLIRGVLREVKQREKTEELNKELDKAYTAQKRANETLEVFMTGLQHDIRGYLTPMVGAPSALLSGDGAFGSKTKKGILLNDNGVRFVKIVGSNAVAAKDQADDFMAIAQQRTGKSIVSLDNNVDIVAMVDEIVNFTRSQLRDRDLEVEFSRPDESWMVPADSTKLKSALRNVIGNAVKYTQKGKVAVEVKKEDNGKVLISVKDSGMGLTVEEINSLFKSPFERTEEARKMTGGTGFGLYFSTLIIGLHNGKIWAESKGKGMGSTFYIELPSVSDKKAPI